MAARHGSFVWYEMMANDCDVAIDFYTQLIGWTTQEFEASTQAYTMWVAGERPFAGLMKLPQEAVDAGAGPHWMAYVAVDDVDRTTARAAELGATVLVPPQEIPEVGKFSVIADPQGAVISPFKSNSEADDDACEGMPMLRFAWHELATSDLEAAWAFYSDLFGWTVLEDMDMGDGFLYRMYGWEGQPPLGGMYTQPPEMPGPPAWLFYVMVEDVASMTDTVSNLGGKVIMGPHEVPGGGSIIQCLDPQGAPFALYNESKG